MSNKFVGIPIAEFVAVPLVAVCDSQKKFALSTYEFMTEIGFNEKGKTLIFRDQLKFSILLKTLKFKHYSWPYVISITIRIINTLESKIESTKNFLIQMKDICICHDYDNAGRFKSNSRIISDTKETFIDKLTNFKKYND